MQDQESSSISLLKAWIVCLTASLFFFYEFVQMTMFNVINPDLMSAFHIQATEAGEISSAYFIANTLFMFPAGILLDRFSTRRIILTAMIICVLGTFCFSFASSMSFALACRFLTGIGGSFPFLCCLRLASRWFPTQHLALVSGVMVSVAMLGGICGQGPMTFLVDTFAWRTALRIDGGLGLIFILLIFTMVRDYPKDYQLKLLHAPMDFDVWGSIKFAMRNTQNWLYGIFTCMLNLPIFLFGAIWGDLYLEQIYHFTAGQASQIVSMIFIGTIIGCPILGALSDHWGLRKLPMYLGAIFSFITLLAILGVNSWTLWEMAALFLLLGFFTSSQVISYPAIAESNDSSMSGSALGLASVLIMGGGAIFQPFCGWLMDLHWQGSMLAGVPQYTRSEFLTGLAILPLACVLGLGAAYLAKETYCRMMNRQREEI